jgi:hypothetical protein
LESCAKDRDAGTAAGLVTAKATISAHAAGGYLQERGAIEFVTAFVNALVTCPCSLPR